MGTLLSPLLVEIYIVNLNLFILWWAGFNEINGFTKYCTFRRIFYYSRT